MAKNETLRVLQRMSEHILRASSPADIAQKLAEELPTITRANSVRLFRFNALSKSIESVPCEKNREPVAASVDRPPEGLMSAAVSCFRDRKPVSIDDARRDVDVNPTHQKGFPRSAFFAPVMFGAEALGVVEATSMRRFGSFNWEERSAIQQLANLVGALFKLQQQGQAQEKTSRAERQAASAQLITDAAASLRPSVDRILELSSAVAEKFPAAEHLTSELRAEALRATEVMARVAAFSSSTENVPVAFDLNALLAELVRFRLPEWNKLNLRVEQHFTTEAMTIIGQKTSIERALLDVIMHAERSAAASADKTMGLGSSLLGGRVVIDVRFPAKAAGDFAALNAPRRVIENHQGELRVRAAGDLILLEMDLPVAAGQPSPVSAAANKPARALTLMLVDGDAVERKQFLAQLSRRGHRVVSVTAEEAPALSTNMRFDSVVWAVRSSGPKWSEYQELLRDSIPAFVLVSDGYDQALAASLGEGGGSLLARPVQDAELDRVLESVISRAAARV